MDPFIPADAVVCVLAVVYASNQADETTVELKTALNVKAKHPISNVITPRV